MKKVTRPTIRTPNEDPDPLGLFAALCAKLEDAYYAQLSVLLRKNLMVGGLEPAVLRFIVDAGTAQGRPVSFPATLIVHPRDATGFALVVGRLETPIPDLSDQPDAPGDGPYINGLFGPVRMRRPKRGWRRFGRRR